MRSAKLSDSSSSFVEVDSSESSDTDLVAGEFQELQPNSSPNWGKREDSTSSSEDLDLDDLIISDEEDSFVNMEVTSSGSSSPSGSQINPTKVPQKDATKVLQKQISGQTATHSQLDGFLVVTGTPHTFDSSHEDESSFEDLEMSSSTSSSPASPTTPTKVLQKGSDKATKMLQKENVDDFFVFPGTQVLQKDATKVLQKQLSEQTTTHPHVDDFFVIPENSTKVLQKQTSDQTTTSSRVDDFFVVPKVLQKETSHQTTTPSHVDDFVVVSGISTPTFSTRSNEEESSFEDLVSSTTYPHNSSHEEDSSFDDLEITSSASSTSASPTIPTKRPQKEVTATFIKISLTQKENSNQATPTQPHEGDLFVEPSTSTPTFSTRSNEEETFDLEITSSAPRTSASPTTPPPGPQRGSTPTQTPQQITDQANTQPHADDYFEVSTIFDAPTFSTRSNEEDSSFDDLEMMLSSSSSVSTSPGTSSTTHPDSNNLEIIPSSTTTTDSDEKENIFDVLEIGSTSPSIPQKVITQIIDQDPTKPTDQSPKQTLTGQQFPSISTCSEEFGVQPNTPAIPKEQEQPKGPSAKVSKISSATTKLRKDSELGSTTILGDFNDEFGVFQHSSPDLSSPSTSPTLSQESRSKNFGVFLTSQRSNLSPEEPYNQELAVPPAPPHEDDFVVEPSLTVPVKSGTTNNNKAPASAGDFQEKTKEKARARRKESGEGECVESKRNGSTELSDLEDATELDGLLPPSSSPPPSTLQSFRQQGIILKNRYTGVERQLPHMKKLVNKQHHLARRRRRRRYPAAGPPPQASSQYYLCTQSLYSLICC